jgi:predicted nuclease of predicted toxin-antitoxin system
VRFLLDHDIPDDVAYVLDALGHEVRKLRELAATTVIDEEVWRLAGEQGRIVITCNRDDFLVLAAGAQHPGLIVLVRRRSRAHERAALVALLDRAGESGIRGNVNFA